MRASLETIPQPLATIPALKQEDSGELTDALLERLNIHRPGIGRRMSPLATALFTAVLSFSTLGGEKPSPSEDGREQPETLTTLSTSAIPRRREAMTSVVREGTHREQVESRLHVDGLHQSLGIDERQFTERLVAVLDPIMAGRQHRLIYTRTPAHLDATYFGLRPGTQLAAQWEELAQHYVGEDGTHQLIVREASLDSQRRHLDIQRMLITIVHEITHGLGRERLPYFVDRVRAGNLIPFAYTQQLLAADHQGESVNFERMGDEYRSKLIECFFSVREIPEGISMEDAVTQYILDRYEVSEKSVRKDVREILSWFPAGTWERCLKSYQAFLRETGIEFEVHVLEEQVIYPVEDEVLRYELSSILHRHVPSPVSQLYALSPSGPDQQALVREVRAYQNLLMHQIETEVGAQYPELVPFLHDWKQTVRLITARNQYHTRSFSYGDHPMMSEHLRNRTVNPGMTDGDYPGSFISEMESIGTTRLNAEWNQIPLDTQEALRPIMLEYARAVSRTFALPPEYEARLAQYLP